MVNVLWRGVTLVGDRECAQPSGPRGLDNAGAVLPRGAGRTSTLEGGRGLCTLFDDRYDVFSFDESGRLTQTCQR